MWQVSGRSDIQDFEEIVKLDLEYIDNWSLLLDIKNSYLRQHLLYWGERDQNSVNNEEGHIFHADDYGVTT